MGAPRKPFDSDAAATAYADGASLKQIAEQQNVAASTVVTRLKEAGVTIRNRGGRKAATPA